jgi:DNA polymerase-1
MKRLILIDGNNWGFSGMANPRLSSGDKDTQAVYSVLKRVRSVYEDHPESMIVVLWDGRSWRKDVYTEYKANRTQSEKQLKDRSAYTEQKKDIVLGLRLLGVSQISANNMEADDLAGIMTINSITKNVPVTLMTADHDWMQLVQPGVQWIDLIHGKTCRHTSFKRDTGFDTPAQFVEAKCILGDRGDNVFGINGIGPKALEGVYERWDSFDDFLHNMETFRQDAIEYWRKKGGKVMPKALREVDTESARIKLKDNYRLMDLRTKERPQPEGLKNIRKPLDREAFLNFCHSNAFLSITRKFDNFIEPFENNINTLKE